MNNSIRLLGIARMAGFLEIGEEAVGSAARAGKARLILTASDASPNALHRARNFELAGGGVVNIVSPYSKEEMGMTVGKGTPSMVALTDIGLASKIASELAAELPEKYTEAAERLKLKAARAAERKKEADAHRRNVRMGKRRNKA